MFFKSILKLLSWDEIKATCSCLISSSSAFNFSLSLVGLPVFMKNLSFQPPALTGLGIAGGDVGLAGARQVESRVGERVDHGRPVNDLDLSRFDAAPLIAFTATKETDYGTETDGGIPARCGAYRIDQWANTQAGG
jgi:hypothetical protein